MRLRIVGAILAMCLSFVDSSWAQDRQAFSAAASQQQQPAQPPQQEDEQEDNGTSSLDALGFGAGLGFRWNVYEPDIVSEATVDANGIVRVNKRNNTQAGLVLETHYFAYRRSNFGIGPFVAVQTGSENLIESVGLGLMFGWEVNDEGRGFGLGFGYSAQPRAKVLGPEFVENQPAPKNASGQPLAVRLQERDKGAIVAVLSVIF